MANEARKMKRAAGRQVEGPRKKGPPKAVAAKPRDVPDPLSPEQLRTTATRLGLPLLAIWIVGGIIAAMAPGSTFGIVALVIPGVLTAVGIGFAIWMYRQATRARGVTQLLQNVDTAEERAAAMEQLAAKKDSTAVFARSQLLLQEGKMKEALGVLETIDLAKEMAQVADQARAQRAMIHCLLGEASKARELADGIELQRHQDAKTRAMLTAVVAESWARTGQAKKAKDTFELIDTSDEELADLRPQFYRSQAYIFAHVGDTKAMRRALRRLCDDNPMQLGGFMGKKTHPLLQKEAKKLLEQSGAVPRKMQVQRR